MYLLLLFTLTPGPGFKEHATVCQQHFPCAGKAKAMQVCEFAGDKRTGCRDLSISPCCHSREAQQGHDCSQRYPDMYSEGQQLPYSPKKSKSCLAFLCELPIRTSQDTQSAHSDGLLPQLTSCLFSSPTSKGCGICQWERFSHWLITG